MHITCERNLLKNAIDQVSKAITNRTPLPILSNILFETTENNKLKLTASSLDIGITCTIPTEDVREYGSTTCSAKVIAEIINNLPSGLVNLDIDSSITSELTVSNETSVFKVLTLPSEEFPKGIKQEDCKSLEIPTKILFSFMNKTIISIADAGESRPIMQGISILFTSDKIEFVSTDGKRLSRATYKFQGEREEIKRQQIIVPGKSLNDLLKVINKNEEIKIQYNKTHLFVSSENVSFFCRLLDGNFPDYDRVIPKEFKSTCKVGKEAIINAIKRMIIMAKDKDIPNVVRFNFEDNSLMLNSETNSIGSAKEEIPILYSGQGLKISFNGNYILDALKILQNEEIVLQLQDEKSSVSISEQVEDEEFTYICMPIRSR